MTTGQSSTMAAGRLNVYRGTANPAVSPYLQLHVGDPGVNGTANQSLNTTRQLATFAAPTTGGMAMSSIAGTWSMTGTETITHLSIWSAPTGGTFQESLPLASPVPVISGSTYTQAALTLTEGPLAA